MRLFFATAAFAVMLPMTAHADRADTFQPTWQVSASVAAVSPSGGGGGHDPHPHPEPDPISTDRPVLGAIIEFLQDIRDRWGRG